MRQALIGGERDLQVLLADLAEQKLRLKHDALTALSMTTTPSSAQ
jgi:hypothetical protein